MSNGPARIIVSIAQQTLTLHGSPGGGKSYQVSTARRGTGCQRDSFQTPTGRHRVWAKIGTGCPAGTVFVGRRPTGQLLDPASLEAYIGKDWILTRILWLQGLEPGANRGGAVDTLRRYIYIHGTAEEHLIGTPSSHGCIRMRNDDVVDLFDRVEVGASVIIR